MTIKPNYHNHPLRKYYKHYGTNRSKEPKLLIQLDIPPTCLPWLCDFGEECGTLQSDGCTHEDFRETQSQEQP